MLRDPAIHGITDSSLSQSEGGNGFIGSEVEDEISYMRIEGPVDENHGFVEQVGEGAMVKGGSEVGEFQASAISSGSKSIATSHRAQGSRMHSGSVETSPHSCAGTWAFHSSSESKWSRRPWWFSGQTARLK